jgi:hypothetical protein
VVHARRSTRIPGWLPTALTALFLLGAPSSAKLNSATYQQERAKGVVDQIFRDTRLNEGSNVWGDQYRQEMDQYTKLFNTSYYAVFADMGVERAMARCAVSARNQPDWQRWVTEMDRFDRAATELDRRDQARYFFAKGLAQLQAIPDKLRELPRDFYRAAENGEPSAFWAEHVLKGDDASGSFGNQRITDILVRFAESYRTGNTMDEAYKLYVLAAHYGATDPSVYVAMAEAASALGNEALALKSALLFLETFSLYDGGRAANTAVAALLPVDGRMPAEEFCRLCESGAIAEAISRARAAQAGVAPKGPRELKPKDLSRFESRYLEPIARSVGGRSDLMQIALCDKYWDDSLVVLWFAPRVSGAIDASDGLIERFAGRLRDDPRFSANKDLAMWEARRWKAAKRLEEFAARFPERYRLAGFAGTAEQ